MPIDEFYDYISLLNKDMEKRNKETNGEENNAPKERPKTIGEVIPGRKRI